MGGTVFQFGPRKCPRGCWLCPGSCNTVNKYGSFDCRRCQLHEPGSWLCSRGWRAHICLRDGYDLKTVDNVPKDRWNAPSDDKCEGYRQQKPWAYGWVNTRPRLKQ